MWYVTPYRKVNGEKNADQSLQKELPMWIDGFNNKKDSKKNPKREET